MTTTRSVLASIAALLLLSVTAAHANEALTQVSSDPFTNSTSTHRTQVEPDTFAFGSTVVSAFQSGRFYSGGSSDIGWATSVDGGATWVHGFLPGITKFQGSGPYDRVSDPSVAYDAAHNVWLVSSLAMLENPSVHGAAVVVSRSVDGGLTWLAPVVTVGAGSDPDKDWTVCDNTAASPFYGHCYTEWDAHGNSNRILMSTSSDGGLTWSAAATTADKATGLGGQPVVQPNGTVVVPIDSAYETKVFSFRSTDGGATWSSKVIAAKIVDHSEAGNVRSSPLISAEVDGAGRVYVVWQDCRFQPNCNANDIVMTTSDDGITWSAVARVPIDGIND